MKTNQCIKKRILIFEPYASGHREEYINNILSIIRFDNRNEYLFALNKLLIQKVGYKYQKVKFIEIKEPDKLSKWQKASQEYEVLLKIFKKYSFDKVIFLDYYTFILASLFKSYGFDISGILYKPFNPKERNSILFRFSKDIQYFLMARRKRIESIFLLNNLEVTNILNKRYFTNKFKLLVDPVVYYTPYNINPYSEKNKIVFLHFGSLDERKGVFSIFEACYFLQPEIYKKILFAFVGKPSIDYKDRIEDGIEKLKINLPDLSIYYNPEFVSNEAMEDYFQFSDCILIPYKYTTMSSGILGHAAKWNKYIIASNGLIGNIVNTYKLGISITPTPIEISKAITCFVMKNPKIEIEDSSKYVKDHSVTQFVKELVQ